MASGIETGKRAAAYAAVTDSVKDFWRESHAGGTMHIGVGSGSTVVYAVTALKEIAEANPDLHMVCVPTSFQARQLIIEAGLPLSDLNQTPELDVAIDGADEVDVELQCIKGGGGCMLQEKCVAVAAKTMLIIADYRKQSKKLGEQWRKGIPVEVVPFAYRSVMKAIEVAVDGSKPVLRQAKAKAGPCVTDNGHFIVDVVTEPVGPNDVKALDRTIQLIPGVVETGLFVAGNIKRAYFGQEDGTVSTLDRPE